ncbi:recombinase family protein [Curtobacterium sp. AB451]|uniref:recombinase family protein n=1 Tax=Curtobacterium sp. AB451 TaxID=3422306 RepID=UPI003D348CF1
MTELLDQLRRGDTSVVWRLDRLGRSIRHLIGQLEALGDRGVGFRSLQETIDTISPSRRLAFHVFAALAEFERDLIRGQTHAGLVAARAQGRPGGRPPRLSSNHVRTARRLHEHQDMTVQQIGEVLGVSRTTVFRAF